MNLYKLEWTHSALYVGANNIAEAVEATKERGYDSDPMRVLFVDGDLVVGQRETEEK